MNSAGVVEGNVPVGRGGRSGSGGVRASSAGRGSPGGRSSPGGRGKGGVAGRGERHDGGKSGTASTVLQTSSAGPAEVKPRSSAAAEPPTQDTSLASAPAADRDAEGWRAAKPQSGKVSGMKGAGSTTTSKSAAVATVAKAESQVCRALTKCYSSRYMQKIFCPSNLVRTRQYILLRKARYLSAF